MKKVKILVLDKHKDRTIELFRKLEVMHFVNLAEAENFNLSKPTLHKNLEEIKGLIFRAEKLIELLKSREQKKEDFKSKIFSALKKRKIRKVKVLENSPEENIKTAKEFLEKIELKLYPISEELNEVNAEEEKVKENLRVLHRIENFDFDVSFLGTSKYLALRIGELTRENLQKLKGKIPKTCEILKEVIGEETAIILVLSLNYDETEKVLKEHGFESFSIAGNGKPKELITTCKNKISELKKKKLELQEKISEISCEYEAGITAMKEVLENDKNFYEVTENFLKTERTYYFEGYVPEKQIRNISKLEREIKPLVLKIEDPKEDEKVPTLLRNPSFLEPFEVFIKAYGTPNYREIDPTFFMALFYPIFFGICLSDIGYGLLILLASLFAYTLYKDSGNDGMISFIKISIICSIPTIILGLLTGSMFGNLGTKIFHLPVAFDLFKRAKIALILAIGIGWMQVFLGFLLNAVKEYRVRNFRGVIDGINWAILEFILGLTFLMLITGYLNSLGTTMSHILLGVFIASVLLAVIMGGIFKILDVSGTFGNILSYCRLFALAMAGGAIGLAISLIADLIPKGWPFGLSIILASLVLLFGHTFSFIMNSMGAYIHSMRLHYIEFFSKFYSGDGTKFTPFKQKRRYSYVEK